MVIKGNEAYNNMLAKDYPDTHPRHIGQRQKNFFSERSRVAYEIKGYAWYPCVCLVTGLGS